MLQNFKHQAKRETWEWKNNRSWNNAAYKPEQNDECSSQILMNRTNAAKDITKFWSLRVVGFGGVCFVLMATMKILRPFFPLLWRGLNLRISNHMNKKKQLLLPEKDKVSKGPVHSNFRPTAKYSSSFPNIQISYCFKSLFCCRNKYTKDSFLPIQLEPLSTSKSWFLLHLIYSCLI